MAAVRHQGRVLVAATADGTDGTARAHLLELTTSAAEELWSSDRLAGYYHAREVSIASNGESLAISQGGPMWIGTPWDEKLQRVAGFPSLFSREPSVTFTGEVWVSAWTDSYSSKLVRVDREGVFVDPGPVPIDPDSRVYSPRVVRTDDGCTLLYRRFGGDGDGIVAARLDPQGEPLAEETTWLAPLPASILSASAQGREIVLLVATGYYGDLTRGLKLIRFLPATGRVEVHALADSPVAPLVNQDNVTLAAGIDRYLVAWRTRDGIWARPLDAKGNWLASPRLVIEARNSALIAPAAVADGSEFVIIAGNFPDYDGLVMTRLDTDGSLIPPVVITGGS